MNTHREVENLGEQAGVVTFEKSPEYLLQILFNNQEAIQNYEVMVKILKPFGTFEPREHVFEFPFSQEGRSNAYLKFVEERSAIDRQRNALLSS
ncbi:MAG: hypothetical protein FWF59_04275 [Turicibacter sp.]|nr:hypothetical protein [Turicibacter sp.]